MSFQITGIQDKSDGKEFVTIYMTLNERTYNCATTLDCFNKKENCKSTLLSMISALINSCYNNDNIKIENSYVTD